MSSTTDRQSARSLLARQSTFEGSKSYDSIISSKSSTHAAKDLYKKTSKIIRTKKGEMPKFVNTSSEVQKCVLSERLLYRKSYNNKLAETDQIISKLKQENIMLLTIHQRQDAALGKYESFNADLPSLLSSHVDEINIWENKYKNLQAINKEIDDKLKSKEKIIQVLNEQNKRLEQLNKNKNLEDRDRLLEKIHDIEIRISAKDDELHKAEHLLTYEIKRAKQQLIFEEKKAKEFSSVLEKSRLEALAQEKLKILNLNKDRQAKAKLPFEKELPTTATESTNEDTDATGTLEFNLSKNQFVKTVDQTARKSPERKLKKIQTKRRIERGDGDAGVTLKLITSKANRNFMKLPKKPETQVLKKSSIKKSVKILENIEGKKNDECKKLNISEILTADEKSNKKKENKPISSGGTTKFSEITTNTSNNFVSADDLSTMGGLGGIENGISELHMLKNEHNHVHFPDNLSDLERETPSNI